MGFRIAIIISLILLGIALFLIKSTERWKRNKRIFVVAAVIAGVFIFGGMGIFIYNRMPVKPVVQTSFWDINFALGKQSILFIKCQPKEVTAEGFWIYESKILGDSEFYYLKFSEDNLWFVGYLGNNSSAGPGIQGIKKGSSLDEVTTLFGKPTHISESNDGFTTLYSYEQYNVFFIIDNETVSAYGMYDPQYGPVVDEVRPAQPVEPADGR